MSGHPLGYIVLGHRLPGRHSVIVGCPDLTVMGFLDFCLELGLTHSLVFVDSL